MNTRLSTSNGLIFTVCMLVAFPAYGTGHWWTLPSGWGQQPDPAAEARERAYQERTAQIVREREARAQRRRDIDALLQNIGPDAYRKYSDGAVVYLGLLLYRHDGFITNSGPAYRYLDKMAVINTDRKST